MSFLLLQSGTLCSLEHCCLIGQPSLPAPQQPTVSLESCKVVKLLSGGQGGDHCWCVCLGAYKILITVVVSQKRDETESDK